MVFVKYKGQNEAVAQLLSPISSGATSVVLETWYGDLFGSEFPQMWKIEQFDELWRVIKREFVKVTARTGDNLTIVRSAGYWPAGYSATTQTNTPFWFSAWDTISLVISAEVIDDMQDEIDRLETSKIDKTGGTFTGLVQWAKSTNIASATTTNLATLTWNFAHVTGTTTITSFGTVTAWTQITLVFDGVLTLTHNATSLILPTGANITTVAGDSAIFESEWSGNWKCVSYVRQDGSPLWAVTRVKFGGTGADGAISWALTITWSNDTYIEKNYSSFAPWANTVTITPTWCITHIKVSWNCDLTWTTFNFSWKWSLWSTTGGVGGWSGTNWTAGVAWSNAVPSTTLHQNNGGSGWVAGTWTPAWTSAGWTLNNIIKQAYFQTNRNIFVTPWAGGWKGGGGRWNTGGTGWNGWNGWNGGGAVILEVAWNLTFSGTTINCSGAIWSNGTNAVTFGGGGGGGWGGGGGMFICFYNWTLSWSVTPNVAWWSGWTGWNVASTATNEWGGGGAGGASGGAVWSNGSGQSSWNWWAGGAGGAWLYLIEKNTVFS